MLQGTSRVTCDINEVPVGFWRRLFRLGPARSGQSLSLSPSLALLLLLLLGYLVHGVNNNRMFRWCCTDILLQLDPTLPANRMQLVNTNKQVLDSLAEFSEKQIIKGFKFGVLYAREDQTKEDEMFSNGMCVRGGSARSTARVP
jgi:hypothetical protein